MNQTQTHPLTPSISGHNMIRRTLSRRVLGIAALTALAIGMTPAISTADAPADGTISAELFKAMDLSLIHI